MTREWLPFVVLLAVAFTSLDADAGRSRKRRVAGVVDGFTGKSMTIIQEEGVRFKTIKRKQHLKFKIQEGSVVDIVVNPKKVKMLKPYNRQDAYRKKMLRKLRKYRKQQEEKYAYPLR